MAVHGQGPLGAKIMFVGEAPGEHEMKDGVPFAGPAGYFFNGLLREHGLRREDVYVTNVARERPPLGDITNFFTVFDVKGSKPWVAGAKMLEGIAALREEIALVNPNIIVPMGNTALWALHGERSISKWRGSILTSKPEFGSRKIIPTYHPAYLMRVYQDKPAFQADLHRIKFQADFPEVRPPERNFIVRPSFQQVAEFIRLCHQAGTFAADIETRGGEISCLGLAISYRDGISIPFMDSKRADGAYWTEDEELEVWRLVRGLLTSPRVELVGQNWSYDASYFCMRRGFLPLAKWDTMVMQQTVFPGTEKSLHVMASMYCHWYRYWKDDGRKWDVSMPDEQHWLYNVEDCAYTLEIKQVLEAKLKSTGLLEKYHWRQDALWPELMKMTLRGIRIDKKAQSLVTQELSEFLINKNNEITYVLGHEVNVRSPVQMQQLLYEDFGCPVILDRKTRRPTTNDDALEAIGKKNAFLRPLLHRIQDIRSAGVLLANFAEMALDEDGRVRCNLNIAGTETFRLSATRNNFGTGGNLQTIPKGDEDDIPEPGRLIAPNFRRMFIPDEGYTLIDMDLNRADLMVVAWEADGDELKQQLLEGYNPYKVATAEFLRVPIDKVPNTKYTAFKALFHGTNYGGQVATMAATCGMTRHETDVMQKWWFGRNPGILKWQERTKAQLLGTKTVRNAFGYRRVYFERPDSVFPAALAWIPQSTVAIVSLTSLVNIAQRVPEAQLLLQVHDSLVYQIPTMCLETTLRKIKEQVRVVVPYPKPLVLANGLAASTKSWGDAKERAWPD